MTPLELHVLLTLCRAVKPQSHGITAYTLSRLTGTKVRIVSGRCTALRDMGLVHCYSAAAHAARRFSPTRKGRELYKAMQRHFGPAIY